MRKEVVVVSRRRKILPLIVFLRHPIVCHSYERELRLLKLAMCATMLIALVHLASFLFNDEEANLQ